MKSDLLMLQILILSLIINVSGSGKDTYAAQACITEQEYRLYELMNDYREEHGLPSIPLSPSLCYVAGAHVWDLNTNQPEGGRCNMHSWSGEGPWTKCCYTRDHKRSSCIWSKPSELTDYDGYGYEVAYYSSWTAERHNDMAWAALEGWKSSPGHDRMIRNVYAWKRLQWKAMGVAIYGNYAVVWFGEEDDLHRKVLRCP
ncbi:MAG: CAP domain-containing protein [Bacteroidetes bacterium]|nr:MAG: CAP domain-containing protein [Bacteroidota bacterium]